MEQQDNRWEQKDSLHEFKKIAGLIISNWYWVVICLAVSVTVGYLGFIRYEDEIYRITATFISKKFDEDAGNRLSEIAQTSQFRQRIEVHQELPLLKSQDRIEETLRRLDFGVSYFVEGRFKLTELYQSSPFNVYLDSSSVNNPFETKIYIDSKDLVTYRLNSNNSGLNKNLNNREFRFGSSYDIDGWKFTIRLTGRSLSGGDDKYYFILNHPATLMNRYRSRLNLSWTYVNSSIITASLQGEIPEKEFDFLKTYLQVVIEKGLEEKNQHLSNTINFVNDYLGQITDTLFAHQRKLDNFRLENRELINGSSYVFNKLNELDAQKTELVLANRYYNYIEEYIRNNRSEEVFAPNLIGLDASPLNELVNQYLEFKWQDKISKNTYNKKNPLVNRSNEEYQRIEKNIFESIKNLKELNKENIAELNQQASFYYQSIRDYQLESREFSEVTRMLSLYESVFDNLITRRTEAYIAKASTVSDYQIVTPPSYNKNSPIYPDTNKVYLISILIGLGLPIGLIYLIFILNEKITSKDDLKRSTNIPILGNVAHSREKDNLIVSSRPKSIVAESFRAIRANIKYFHPNGQNLTVMVTSFMSGEGKTFCSTNLAYTYALAEKKTLLLGADLRKPAFAANFHLTKAKGLSDYLVGIVEDKEIFYQTDNEYLTIIPGGRIPPNPAELVMSSKMQEFIESLKKKYDVIIIDTPPIGIVSDSMEMLRFSHVNLLIVRQSVTNKKSLQMITEMYNNQRLPKLAVLFNDINFNKYEYGYSMKGYGSKYGYAYGYGHGYYSDEKVDAGWWKKMWKR